jgi:hypothetical protein
MDLGFDAACNNPKKPESVAFVAKLLNRSDSFPSPPIAIDSHRWVFLQEGRGSRMILWERHNIRLDHLPIDR